LHISIHERWYAAHETAVTANQQIANAIGGEAPRAFETAGELRAGLRVPAPDAGLRR
jgi:hypothetical protein